MNSENILTAEELEVYNYYLDEMKDCPSCKNKDRVLTYVVGRPSPILINVAHKTKRIRLSGCIIDGESKKFGCEKCQTKFN
jgi:hypothetical protein